jgi:hypothetical protein
MSHADHVQFKFCPIRPLLKAIGVLTLRMNPEAFVVVFHLKWTKNLLLVEKVNPVLKKSVSKEIGEFDRWGSEISRLVGIP